MNHTAEQYFDLLDQLTLARKERPLTQEEEIKYTFELDELWRSMTAEQQDEVERIYKEGLI